MSLRKAAARRLRRIYLYLFAVQIFAWGLKVSSTTEPPATFVSSAQIAAIPGSVVIVGVALVFGAIAAFAIRYGGVERSGAVLARLLD